MLELSYTAQHRALSYTQTLLEQACFEFLERAFPSILENNGWDCAAALELDRVAKALRGNEKETRTELKLESKPMGGLLDAVTEIRNVAVHRDRMSAKQLVRILQTAVDLLTALDDTKRLEQMRKLSHRVRTLLLKLDADVARIQSGLNTKEGEISDRIRALRKGKQMLRLKTAKSLNNRQRSAGAQLEKALERAIPLAATNGILWDRNGQTLLAVLCVVLSFMVLWLLFT